jgi:hypothetical protein
MPEGHSTGPWQAAGTARPLYWWDERGLQSLAKALEDQLARWRAAWGIGCDAAGLRCQPAGQLPDAVGDWLAFDAAGTAQAWFCVRDDKDAGLLQALFPGVVAPGPLACSVAGACRRDAIERIATLLGLACVDERAEAPAAALTRVGSGAVEADLAAPPGARLLVGPEVAARWRKGRKQQLRPREVLVAATEAATNESLLLQVELDGCELEVGALQGLQVGDVVRLDHGLQTPASVRHGGEPLCNAYLGRRGNRKAVELAGRLHPAPGRVPR